MGRKCASLYESLCKSRGYERLEGEERERLEELAGDNQPHEIWIGDGESRTWFGNVVLSRKECESYGQSEIEALFLHEMGHVRDKASYKIASLLILIIILMVVPSVVAWLADVLTLIALYAVVVGIALLFVLFLYKKYPKYEYSADEHATNNGYGEELISVLQDRGVSSLLRNPNKVFYPPTESRIKQIRRKSNKQLETD